MLSLQTKVALWLPSTQLTWQQVWVNLSWTPRGASSEELGTQICPKMRLCRWNRKGWTSGPSLVHRLWWNSLDGILHQKNDVAFHCFHSQSNIALAVRGRNNGLGSMSCKLWAGSWPCLSKQSKRSSLTGMAPTRCSGEFSMGAPLAPILQT